MAASVIEELRRQILAAWHVTRAPVTGSTIVAGRTVTARYVPAGIARFRFRWAIDGKPATLREVTALAHASQSD